jgi:hypothetical protein
MHGGGIHASSLRLKVNGKYLNGGNVIVEADNALRAALNPPQNAASLRAAKVHYSVGVILRGSKKHAHSAPIKVTLVDEHGKMFKEDKSATNAGLMLVTGLAMPSVKARGEGNEHRGQETAKMALEADVMAQALNAAAAAARRMPGCRDPHGLLFDVAHISSS